MLDLSLDFLYRQAFVPLRPISSDVDLTGKTVLITGANVGIGLATSKILAQHKVNRIILGVRDMPKGENAKSELTKLHSGINVEIWPLDYDSFENMSAFCKRAESLDRLDITILNAGNKPIHYAKSPTGHESTLQVNHLGTSFLSLLLLPVLTRTAHMNGNASRLTIVSSEVHFWTPFDERHADSILEYMDQPDTFSIPWRYNTTKLFNVFWTRELAARTRAVDILINTVNPGLTWSDLHREDNTIVFRIFRTLFARIAEQAGHAVVDAAVVQPQDTHGAYISEQKPSPPADYVRSLEGQAMQRRVWDETLVVLRKDTSGGLASY